MGWNHQPHTVNVWYIIFTYIWLISMVNVGKYTSPMDPMGTIFAVLISVLMFQEMSFPLNSSSIGKLPGAWYSQSRGQSTIECVEVPILGELRKVARDFHVFSDPKWRACFFETQNHQNHGVGWGFMLLMEEIRRTSWGWSFIPFWF